MATGYKECKVCGKQYEYCMTERNDNIFRWQDVACSPEHGAIYFKRIAESRAPKNEAPAIAEPEDETDELFEEEFDDSEEEIPVET